MSRQQRKRQSGKIVVMFAVLLPALLGVLGLIFDGGLLMGDCRQAQQVVDGAATAAAMDLRIGKTSAAAIATAEQFVANAGGFDDAILDVNIPPLNGSYAGRTGFVEVTIRRPYRSRIMQVVGSANAEFEVRAVAGLKSESPPTAILVLDPKPTQMTIQSLPPLLPGPLSLLAGFEVEGLGQVEVDGSVLINTTFGGVDENGNPAGAAQAPPYAATCMPLLPLTQLRAREIRVAGGVDNPDNYGHFNDSEPSPLSANKLPVPDPLADVPVPTVGVDAQNVVVTNYGGVRVVALPILSPTQVLRPGVYDWIEIVSGRVVFEPGVYVVRGKNPLTNISLNIIGGNVTGHGVMFYVTNSTGYDVTTGAPDADDGEAEPDPAQLLGVVPSVVIAGTLLNSDFSPLDDPSSPFDGMTIFQRRHDRRPIVIAHQSLLLNGGLAGRIYAKWGHLTLVTNGEYDASFAVGTMRIVTLFDTVLAPTNPLPAPTDVFLVE